MEKFSTLTLLLSLIFTSSVSLAEPASNPTLDQQKLSRLDLHLDEIRSTAKTERLVGGSVLLGLGALTAVVEPRDESKVAGAIIGAVGIGVLIFPTDRERLPNDYKSLPTTNAQEITQRVTQGEMYLDRLADRGKKGRIIGGFTAIGVGAASLIIYSTLDRDETDLDTTLLILGSATLGAGVAALLVPTESETERESYRTWKAGLPVQKSALEFKDVGVISRRGDLGVGAVFSF